jgi:8-oxo-dGTP pyrophosphatase MutT (NUDIX family)
VVKLKDMVEQLPFPVFPYDDPSIMSLVCAQDEYGHILMGRKTRGFGAGKLVLPGGKGTQWLDSQGVGLNLPSIDASRELEQETGVIVAPEKLTHAGALFVENADSETSQVNILRYRGRLTGFHDSDELHDVRLVSQIDYEQTPADYALWLPHILGGRAVNAFLWHASEPEVLVFDAPRTIR